MTHYTERDIEAQGQYYLDHVAAMTDEHLDSKSRIAAELAYRDIRIAELQAKVSLAEKAGMKFGIMKEVDKEAYLTYDLREGSDLGRMAEAEDREILRQIDEAI